MTPPSERIMGHMNNDHQLALIDYLVAYGKISVSAINQSTVKMVGIDEKAMTIDYKNRSGQNHSFLINWDEATEDENLSVNSLADVKNKLISMAKYSASKQGYSHQQITKVLLPRDAKSLFWYAIFFYFVLSSYDKTILYRLVKNDKLLSKLGSILPSSLVHLASLLDKYSYKILLTMYPIHLIEVFYITLPKLVKYRVPLNQKFIWIIMNFIEGFFVILRFNSLVY